MAKGKRISVIRQGRELDEGYEDEADYDFPSFSRTFGTHVNTIPMHTAVAAARTFYGARFVNQALPMVNRETPLVMNADDDGESFDQKFGEHAGAIRAKAAGVVKAIKDRNLIITGDDGKDFTISTYKDFPFNRKSGLTQTIVPKVGDRVEKGGLLATSNYTDGNGGLALGINARVAVVPYMAWTIDDASAVSASFAKRAKSEHLYGYNQDVDENTVLDKNHYISLFPTNFTKEQIDRMDDKGIIQPGHIVKKGDPLILATVPKSFSGAEQLGKLSKVMRDARRNAATVWDKDTDGVVTDVAQTKDGPVVYVKTERELREGDKIVLRPGQKGVVSKIIPDDKMPRTEDGKPLDLLLNPLGLYSRINANTPYEILLSKVARLTGKPYKLPNSLPPGKTWLDFVEGELARNKVQAKERVYDPELGKFLQKPVLVGETYLLKLHHTGDSKISGRSQGSYTKDEQPSKGGGEMAQAKRFSGLENYGLLSVGAPNIQKENVLIRGQKNEDFWQKIRTAQTPAMPGAPFVWHKYRALLNAAGLHASDRGAGILRLGPMTDKELESRKPFEITSADALDPHTLEPIPGGAFDQAMVATNKWGAVSLPFPIVNPAFEVAARKLLGLTGSQFREVMAGRMELPTR